MMGREIESVSFSKKDEYEKKLHEFAKRPDHGAFSKYVKRLISMHMEGWEVRTTQPEFVEKSVNYVDKKAMMSYF